MIYLLCIELLKVSQAFQKPSLFPLILPYPYSFPHWVSVCGYPSFHTKINENTRIKDIGKGFEELQKAVITVITNQTQRFYNLNFNQLRNAQAQ